MAKPRYLALQLGYVDLRLVRPGEVFEFAGEPGSWMVAVDRKTPLGAPKPEQGEPRWLDVSEREEAERQERARRMAPTRYREANWPCFDRRTVND